MDMDNTGYLAGGRAGRDYKGKNGNENDTI